MHFYGEEIDYDLERDIGNCVQLHYQRARTNLPEKNIDNTALMYYDVTRCALCASSDMQLR